MGSVKTKREIVKIAGKHNELITVTDERGNILQKMVKPVMVKFYSRDLMQVMVGASILAIPVAFTEETWKLGESLPLSNIIGLMFISLIFISGFVYYNYYKNRLREHKGEFVKRVITTYLVAFLVVTLLLTLIERAPWSSDYIVAFGRTVIVSFPAAMSAAVADMIK
ncbi:MAG: DUF2391 family protein [Candidatus Aenigmarchaeota archaeon]|nr:DUF2391 family protein [Candidatus Aenigmarchaeota archaeon]